MGMLRTFTIILTIFYSSLYSLALYTPSHLNWQWNTLGTPFVKKPLFYKNNQLFFVGLNRLYKLNPQDGQLIWNSPQSEPFKSPVKSWCTLEDQYAYLVLQDSSVKAFDLKSGKELWSYQSLAPLGEEIGICEKTLILFTHQHFFIALDLKNGKPIWDAPYQVFQGIKSKLSYHENKIYGITKDNQLFSFNISLKKFDWSIELKKPNLNTQPIVSGNQLIVLDQNILICVSAITGQTLWKTDVGELTMGSPVISLDKIAVITFQGKICTFDFEGKVVDKGVSLGTGLTTALTWSGRNLLAYDSRKILRCLEPQSQNLIWSYEIFPGLDDPNLMNIKRIEHPQSPFVEGRKVWVWDGKKSILHFNNEKGFDKSGPQIKMVYPQPGNIFPVQKKLSMIFRTWDLGSGVNPESIRISIDGKFLKYEYYLEGKLVCTPPPNFKGRKLVIVKIDDWKGNITEEIFPVYFE